MVGDELFEVSMQSTAGEYNYIYGRQGEAGSMECLGRLGERITIRPYITGDQAHRKYLAASTVASAKSNADVRVKMAVTTTDPEREKQRMIKLEQEKIKERRKIEAKRRNLQQRSFEQVSRTGLTARFLEEGNGSDEFYEEEGRTREELDEYEEDFIDDTNIDEEEEEEEEENDHSTGEEEVSSESGIESESGSDAEFSNKQSFVDGDEKSAKRSRTAPIIDDDDDGDTEANQTSGVVSNTAALFRHL